MREREGAEGGVRSKKGKWLQARLVKQTLEEEKLFRKMIQRTILRDLFKKRSWK